MLGDVGGENVAGAGGGATVPDPDLAWRAFVAAPSMRRGAAGVAAGEAGTRG